MSLKAKIEAVIYASEEPVTLAQLASLLGVEAQAELDVLDAQQGSLLPLETAPDDEEAGCDGIDPEALNAETLGSFAEDGKSPEASEEPASENAAETSTHDAIPMESAEAQGTGSAFAESLTTPGETTSGETAPSETPATAPVGRNEDGEKRLARERERRLRDHFRSILDRLMADFAEGDRGLEIREVAGGFRFATKPEFHDTVRGFVRSLKPPLKLSLQALETLAVVAYKQPVTAPEVSEIRGVDSGGVLGSLIARKLITTAGRKQVIGRPILYKTTREFLLRFGLKDTGELPSIEEFEKMAGELAEAVQEEIDMEQAPGPNRSEESDEAAASGDSPAVDEINTAPASTEALHGSAEEMVADHGAASGGAATEPSEDKPGSSDAVEPMRNVHEAQADGVPDSTTEPGSEDDMNTTSRE